ncbi:methionine synthase [Cetobacterium somerae]|uniref:Methionine synthase n=1 Tax=Cetobacterium somerae ATCC BAA-474 TaxID=1319815 RepID=U7V983_9FUSO|nr:methionine synthase [Cetobacterium somerae]ERT68252.1 hypothetical protein HMPREF0202_01857 [Cetobacterium somerae ATCC BAA-474]
MLTKKKIYILDGATGTVIQDYHLSEKDYTDNNYKYIGCHEILNKTRQDIILDIHKKYIEAGADIIETNTFNSNSISLKDYGLENESYFLSFLGAKLAREAVENSKKEILVAGSIGPTNKSASISTSKSILDREIDFNELFESYLIQARGLVDGGVDLFLIETIFDGLNAKAAVIACEKVAKENSKKIPIMISATVNKNGKILSGQDIKSLITSLDRDSIISFGLNCSFGAKDLIPLIESLNPYTDKLLSVYPNAGLPNENGEYDEKPQITLEYLKKLIDNKKINIIGGCCGTTPAHIKLISDYSKNYLPREINFKEINKFFLAGNLPLEDNKNFYLIGERNNVAGSRKFKRLIEEKKYEEAIEIAKEQIENGADIIDINLDDALLDSKKEFEIFLKTLSNDSVVSQVPIMIDSSNFQVIKTALKNISGKAIVNSISLKDGEKEFLKKAEIIKNFSAALVIMAFDENGQGIDFERKIEICQRSYNLLIKNGWNEKDLIFDPNILTIGTGLKEDRYHAVNFFKATKWITENLKGVKISGGISNVSFAFRGNNPLRQLIHKQFLKEAIKNGLNMGIINPNEKNIKFPVELVHLVDRLILGEEVVEDILKFCKTLHLNDENNENLKNKIKDKKNLKVEERLHIKILEGKSNNLEFDLKEALEIYTPLDIIQTILMTALVEVGNKFEQGEFYLPQIIKSAIIMEKAVKYLTPYINQNETYKSIRGKILMCTVKGDVHDIGKNITKIVLKCNGYEIIDLGVMVEKERIYHEAIKNNVDIVTLSGLITPSLSEMGEVLELFEKNKINIPIIIGGAATSKLHTALKLEPKYKNKVFHVTDASSTVPILNSLLNKESDIFKERTKKEYDTLRSLYFKNKENLITKNIEIARLDSKYVSYNPIKPKFLERVSMKITLDKILPYIDWSIFLATLKVKKTQEESKILKEAYSILDYWLLKEIHVKAVYKIYSTTKNSDTLDIDNRKIPLIRNQGDTNESLSDYIETNDYVGAFVASIKPLNEENIFEQLLANTIIEGASSYLQEYISKNNWNINIRPAIGYPCLPDHSIKKDIFEIINGEETGASLSSNFAMTPSSTICGIYIGNPKSEYISPKIILDDQIKEISKIKDIDLNLIKKYMGL